MAKNKNEGEIRRRKTLRYEKEKGSGDCRMGVSAVRLCAPVPDCGGGGETKAVRQNVFVVQFSISWLHRVPSIGEYTLANCLIKLREAVFGDFISFPFTPN